MPEIMLVESIFVVMLFIYFQSSSISVEIMVVNRILHGKFYQLYYNGILIIAHTIFQIVVNKIQIPSLL